MSEIPPWERAGKQLRADALKLARGERPFNLALRALSWQEEAEANEQENERLREAVLAPLDALIGDLEEVGGAGTLVSSRAVLKKLADVRAALSDPKGERCECTETMMCENCWRNDDAAQGLVDAVHDYPDPEGER